MRRVIEVIVGPERPIVGESFVRSVVAVVVIVAGPPALGILAWLVM